MAWTATPNWIFVPMLVPFLSLTKAHNKSEFMWCCVGGKVKRENNLALSNELIELEFLLAQKIITYECTGSIQFNWSIVAKTLHVFYAFQFKNTMTLWDQRIGPQVHAHFAYNASLIFRLFDLWVSKVGKLNICYSMQYTIWQTQKRFSDAHFEAYGIFQQINAKIADKKWTKRNGATFGRYYVITS